MKQFNCEVLDKDKKEKKVGFLEIKNEEEDEKNTELYIYGDIVSYKWSNEDVTANDVTEFLKPIANGESIDVYINSGGGSVYAGLAIYNQLKRKKCDVTVHVDGLAASIASVIMCAGDRIIVPTTAQVMIHKPSLCYFWTSMNADDLRKDADNLDKSQQTILNVYMQKVNEGITKEQINNYINEESWFTGDELQELFDIEIEESKEAVACSSDFLNKYKNVPKDLKTKSFFNAKNQEKDSQNEMSEEEKEMLSRIKSMPGFDNWGRDLI